MNYFDPNIISWNRYVNEVYESFKSNKQTQSKEREREREKKKTKKKQTKKSDNCDPPKHPRQSVLARKWVR